MSEAYIRGFMDKCAEAGVDPEALVKLAGRGDQTQKLLRLLGIENHQIIMRNPGTWMYGDDIRVAAQRLKGQSPVGDKIAAKLLWQLKKLTTIEKIKRPSLESKLTDARAFHGRPPKYISEAGKADWQKSLEEYLSDVENNHNRFKDLLPIAKRVKTEVNRGPVEDGYW